MQIAVPKPMTREQFLAWEVRQELAQDEMDGTLFERIDDDWVGHLLNADSLLRRPEIGIEIALTELYEEVEFPIAGSVPQPH